MKQLVDFIQRHSIVVLIVTGLITALSVLRLPLDYDDDVVSFLPQDDPEVAQFNVIMDRFGSLNVALIGIEGAETLYSSERLSYVRAVTETLRDLDVVDHVTSLTELAVVTGKETGEHKALVPHPIPDTPEALAEVRDYIQSLDYIVGSLASADGKATMLIARLKTTVDGNPISTTQAALSVREAAEAITAPGDTALHFGGAPFIAEAAANGSQRDLARLGPYVCAIIILLILFTLGSWKAALVTVVAVGMGILWTLGLMGWLDQPLTLVSTSLPVILVALGSAYAVHLLVWYLEHDADIESMLLNVGWPVLVTALTTMAGFVSFLAMDLAPMRWFGAQMAIGTAICALVALVVVPAILKHFPLTPKASSHNGDIRRFDQILTGMAAACRKNRWGILVFTAIVAVFFANQLGNIRTSMDTKAFFEEDSAPARADDFLVRQFGGSVFLQIYVKADLRDPATLARIAAFEDRLAALEGVTRVESISKVVAIVHEGLSGERRLSRKRAEIEQFLYLARQTDPAVGLLVDDTYEGALIQVGIGGFDTSKVMPLTEKIRALAKTALPKFATTVSRSAGRRPAVVADASERIAGLLGESASTQDVEKLLMVASGGGSETVQAELDKAVLEVLNAEVVEEEMVILKEDTDIKPFATAVAKGIGTFEMTADTFVAAITNIADPSELAKPKVFNKGARYVWRQLEKKVAPLIQAPVTAALKTLTANSPKRVKIRVAAIVDEVMQPTWAVGVDDAPSPAHVPLSSMVSGYPVIQEAMTKSVQHNQTFSLMVSLPLILLIMVIVFRSLLAGLIGLLPTALTLLVTFGLMGMLPQHLPLDITASMLASIALGVGVDYAIHFMWRYRESGTDGAIQTTGRSILINAAEITGGFVVLAWASIVPMSRFGLLTAETLLVAAAATLILLPALLDWWQPSPSNQRAPTGGKA